MADLGSEEDLEDEIRGTVEISARLLYGLIHQRWIVTSRGLAKMVHTRHHQELHPTLGAHYHTLIHSLRSTKKPISDAVPVSSATPNPSSPAASPTSPTKNPSNSTAHAAKTFTPLNQVVMDPSTAPTLAQRFRTCSSWSTHT